MVLDRIQRVLQSGANASHLDGLRAELVPRYEAGDVRVDDLLKPR